MTVLHDTTVNLPAQARGSVVAIGNFDGLHLGHRALIGAAAGIAKATSCPLSVLTFEPHPREFFRPKDPPFRLTLLPMKRRLLDEMGVDHLFVLGFDAALAGLSAAEFIREILVKRLAARHIVIGADFAFGKDRGGTADTLRAVAGREGFEVTVLDPVQCGNREAFSSTRIRNLLQQGKFGEAAALLGHTWQLEMPVVHGDKRGRDLGYPTANQRIERYLRPPYGVYAVRVQIEGEAVWRDGAANFGIRPMFRVDETIFETYIFDFSGDIYGKMVRVQPVAHIRPEMSFGGLEALKERIKQDCVAAQAVLKSTRL